MFLAEGKPVSLEVCELLAGALQRELFVGAVYPEGAFDASEGEIGEILQRELLRVLGELTLAQIRTVVNEVSEASEEPSLH